jgi:hypothetical protein
MTSARKTAAWYGAASVCLFVIAMCPAMAAAQTFAAISGVVTDPSAAGISAATVTARHLETTTARTTMTDMAGRYRLPALAVGAYEVTVARNGFQTTVRTGIHLVVAQGASLDVTLQIGGVSEQVTVVS